MESIEVKVLTELFNNKSKYLVSNATGYKGVPDGESSQGEYNQSFKYYQHPKMPKNIFLQEEYRTDSYGYNEFLYFVTFVEGKQKTIIVYEPITNK